MNYAAASNGAKIVSANPESKATAVNALKELLRLVLPQPVRDERNRPGVRAAANKWITVGSLKPSP